MKISYEWLKDYIKDLLPIEKVAEDLTMHSFETDVINKNVLDVEVPFNRGDCLSHLGIARELKAIYSATAPPAALAASRRKRSKFHASQGKR